MEGQKAVQLLETNGTQQPPHDVTKLMSFFAQEMQLFFGHVQASVLQFNETGEVPHSLFSDKEVKGAEKKAVVVATAEKKSRKEKRPRKPSAFNFFVKDKMEELKASGVKPPEEAKGNALFGLAVAEWSKLSAEEKKGYQDKYAGQIAASGGVAATPAPAATKSPAASPSKKAKEAPAPAPASVKKEEKRPAAEKAGKDGEEPKKKKKKHHHKEQKQQ